MTELSFYDNFKSTWLFESPMYTRSSGYNTYDDLVYGLKLNIDHGVTPVSVGDHLMTLPLDDHSLFCWHGNEEIINIICILHKFNKGYSIGLVGKSNKSPIYASDFYELILNKLDTDLLFSGDILNDDSIKIWDRLLSNGKNIFVYDPTNSKNFKKLSSPVELKDFLGNEDFKKFRYVLTNHSHIIESSFVINRAYMLTFKI